MLLLECINSKGEREPENMKQFTIELDEMVCKWLLHIAEVTGETVENIISNGIFHQVERLEESAVKSFTYRE